MQLIKGERIRENDKNAVQSRVKISLQMSSQIG